MRACVCVLECVHACKSVYVSECVRVCVCSFVLSRVRVISIEHTLELTNENTHTKLIFVHNVI